MSDDKPLDLLRRERDDLFATALRLKIRSIEHLQRAEKAEAENAALRAGGRAMSTDDAAVEAVMRVLTEWGAAEPGADGIHSWRCSYPERFGPCSCADEFCHEVAVALAAAAAAENEEADQ